MKVKDMPYEHLTIEEIRQEARAIIDEVKNAKCHNCVLRARDRMHKLMVRYQSNASLCYIRYSCNTADEYYVKEHEYFDEIGPEMQALLTEASNALLESPHRHKLEAPTTESYTDSSCSPSTDPRLSNSTQGSEIPKP